MTFLPTNDAVSAPNALLKMLQTTTNSGTTLSDFNAAVGKTTDLNTTLNGYYSDQYNILTQQENTKHVLNKEYNRLQLKKQSMDNAINSQNRMTDFNSSYAKRYQYYNYIMLIAAIMLASFIAMIMVKRYIPVVPDALVTVVSIAIFSFGTVYIGWLLYDFYRRDTVNFDKLSPAVLTPPPQTTDKKVIDGQDNVANAGSGVSKTLTSLSDLAGCVNDSCCDTGTKYNQASHTCKKEPFIGSPDVLDASMSTLLPAASLRASKLDFSKYP